MCLRLRVSVCISVRLSVRRLRASVCISVRLSVQLSVCLSVCRSACLSECALDYTSRLWLYAFSPIGRWLAGWLMACRNEFALNIYTMIYSQTSVSTYVWHVFSFDNSHHAVHWLVVLPGGAGMRYELRTMK